jgi:hypothetical protein
MISMFEWISAAISTRRDDRSHGGTKIEAALAGLYIVAQLIGGLRDLVLRMIFDPAV